MTLQDSTIYTQAQIDGLKEQIRALRDVGTAIHDLLASTGTDEQMRRSVIEEQCRLNQGLVREFEATLEDWEAGR